MSVQIVEIFKKDAIKDTAAVVEIVQLAPVLDDDHFRFLFTTFINTVNHSEILHLHSLEGLAKVIQGAGQGSIDSDDLVRILQSLQRKLESTHSESIRNRHHLLLAVSRVLESMGDAHITDVDRINIHGPLTDLLRESESADNPYLAFQSAYATQALLNVSDDDNIWRAGFRRGWLTLKAGAGYAKVPDITEIKDALEGLEGLYEIGKGGARLLKDAMEAIKNHERPSFTAKEGLKFKRAWYRAVRTAESYIQAGKLVQFMDLVTTVPCRHQLMFQWGICQLLGQFVCDSRWGSESRQEAICLLGAFYKSTGLWDHQKEVDQVIFDVLTNVTTSNSTGFEAAQYLLEEMKCKNPTLKPIADLKSPLWNNTHSLDPTRHVTAKATLLKTVQIQYPWQPRLGIHKALKTYHAPDLFIRRVSGEELDLATCFVNLAIVEATAHRQKEKQNLKDQATVFHRIPSFERVENTNTEALIPLEHLFDKRKLRDGKEVVPKRILVQGRAGIGKTTLCKKLVHAHQNGWWRDLFDVVLWIPLRQLRGFKGNTLECLFREKVFITQNHDQRQAALAEALSTCAGKGRVLFILDGVDEIVADTEGDERKTFRSFLMALLRQQYVVITSRPSGLDSKLLPPIDLEVETVGFSQQNVKDFLVRVLEPEAVRTVQDFIQRTPLIQGLVNIPVQLDVICFSWDKLPTDGLAITMTGLYQLMVRKLWCKDAVRLKKTAGGMSLTEQEINDMALEDVDELMATELLHLGYLAFKGMSNNHQIEFEEQDLLSAFRDLRVHTGANQRLLPPQLVKVMKQTSFLHTADVDLNSKNNNSLQAWHFLHLTFQEYFAATWIVRHFYLRQECLSAKMMSKAQLANFVHQHKYNPQYEIVWSMVAGLLEGEGLMEFFAFLQGAPRDLIGGRHQLVLASCFNEAHGRLDSKYAEEVDEELRKWLRFEMQTLQHDEYALSSLGSQLSFPEASLIATLSCESSWKATLARTLRARSIISEDATNFLTVALKDEDGFIRTSAAEALGKHSVMLESVIHLLVKAAIEDTSFLVRLAAVDALGNNATLPEFGIQALIVVLKEVKQYFLTRVSALEALGKQNMFPESAIQPVVASLKDHNGFIRSAAASVLSKHGIPQKKPIIVIEAKHKDINSSATSVLDIRCKMPKKLQPAIAARKDDHEEVRSAATSTFDEQFESQKFKIRLLTTLHTEGKDENQDVRSVTTLASRGYLLPESAIRTPVDPFKDGDEEVSSKAAQPLVFQSLIGTQTDENEEVNPTAASTVRERFQFDIDVHRSEPEYFWAAASSSAEQSKLLESAIESLIDALKNEDKDVRFAATRALRKQFGLPESAFKSLVEVLKDENKEFIWAAADVLGNQSELPESVVQSLVDALKNERKDVRSAARGVLDKQSQLSDSAIKSLVEVLKDERYAVRQEARSILYKQSELPKSGVQSLVEVLKDGKKDVRSAAASILGYQFELPESVVQSLVGALKDEDSTVGYAAAGALRNITELTESVVHSIVEGLKDENEGFRHMAAHTLGNRSELPESAVKSLVDAIKDGNGFVRSDAAEALGSQANMPESAVESLAHTLKDENKDFRCTAAIALGYRPGLPESAVGSLVDALKDGDKSVRSKAAEALGKQSQLPESAIESLVVALGDEHQYVRFAAMSALKNHSAVPETAIQPLIAIIKQGTPSSKNIAPDVLGIRSTLPESAIRSLIALLQDGDTDARLDASQALRLQGHSICIALPQLTKDEISSVYESCLFYQSCRRVLSLQVQDGRLRIYTDKGEISETIGNDVQENILSAMRAVHDKQGLKL
ncbi:hypothetical protein EMPS_09912 [Entomortierella parvispora]|uniref:NACHT domain-containing protein n=1 Tax=Entomortierella parvispora TaxID=205924 RepID=A0A9P3HJG8_9FUNG|nr:hypothetical protein EMPS_09912 [Entomortierella parvispora]